MEPTLLIGLAAIIVAVLAVASIVLLTRRNRRHVPTPSAATPARSASGGLQQGLLATSRRLAARLDTVLGGGPRSLEVTLSALEEVLIGSDVGVTTAAALVADVRGRVPPGATAPEVRAALRVAMAEALRAAPAPPPATRPWVVLVTGVNGVGKTTTVGKLALLHRAAGRRVLLVAADTFRAAAIDQLAVWAGRSGADLVRHAPGGDPAAVVFDGMKAAQARAVDVVLVDTAGRLHTRTPLMDELRKLRRVVEREVPGAPHEVLLVLDATTGQNALGQARAFGGAAEVTGVVLAKLDGTAKGGMALAVRQELGIPIRYVGVGEGVCDLRPFDAEAFVSAVLDSAEPGPARDTPGGAARK